VPRVRNVVYSRAALIRAATFVSGDNICKTSGGNINSGSNFLYVEGCQTGIHQQALFLAQNTQKTAWLQ